MVSGLRAEQRIATDKLLAVNWAYGSDIVRSIPLDPVTGREPFVPVANNVVSLDIRMVFARIWNLEGEIPYSSRNLTNPDPRSSSDNRKDYALRFDNSVRQGPWTVSLYYTRIMPSFLAVNARQVAYLLDVLFRASVSLSPQVAAQATYRRTNDALRERSSNPGTVFQMPEFRISFRDLPAMGSTLIDAGYRERRQDQDQKLNSLTLRPIPGIGADRLTRTPFVEVGILIASGQTPPGTFRDKAVFVGASAIGIGAMRPTPFLKQNYPGVEIHANVLDNLLHDNFRRRGFSEEITDLVTLLFCGLVMGLLFVLVRPLVSTVLFAVALLGLLRFVYYNFSLAGRWLPLVLPAATLSVNYLGVTS